MRTHRWRFMGGGDFGSYGWRWPNLWYDSHIVATGHRQQTLVARCGPYAAMWRKVEAAS